MVGRAPPPLALQEPASSGARHGQTARGIGEKGTLGRVARRASCVALLWRICRKRIQIKCRSLRPVADSADGSLVVRCLSRMMFTNCTRGSCAQAVA